MCMKRTIITIIVLAVTVFVMYRVFLNTKNNATPIAPVVPVSQTEQATTVPAQTPSVKTVQIEIKNFAFAPKSQTIQVGTTVTWVNRDSAPHTIVSDTGNVLHSPMIASGETFSHTFTATDLASSSTTLNYHCSIHPMMKGTLNLIQ